VIRGLALGWEERKGFRECDSSCLTRNSRTILFHDFPILREIRPLLTGMRKLDQVAFAAELLQLGYSIANVHYGCGLSSTTIVKLRDRMRTKGMIPEKHRRVRPKAKTPASFTADNQPRHAASGHKGVYWAKDKCRWRVQRRVDGKAVTYGLFVTQEAAIAKSREVFSRSMNA